MFPDQFVLPCSDLDESIKAAGDAGFRLEMIMPADSPKTAIVSKNSCFVRFECTDGGFSPDSLFTLLKNDDAESHLIQRRFTKRAYSPEADYSESENQFLFSSGDSSSWESGRAGMFYRDLIPGRLGGRFIGSQIRIPKGGPVEDYVHYHDVNFQIIFCRSGWVKVVYEDQGEPFILNPGDCVLQPPKIRHRVLESSDDLEVIEISSPAIHPTFTDHEIELPNSTLDPERVFNSQRFARFVFAESEWTPFKGFNTKDTGIGAATSGLADVRLLKDDHGSEMVIKHFSSLLFWYVMNGQLTTEGGQCFTEGDSLSIPSDQPLRVSFSEGCQVLEVRVI